MSVIISYIGIFGVRLILATSAYLVFATIRLILLW